MIFIRSFYPTKQTYEQRIILLYFAAKTLQHQLPLSVGHVPKVAVRGHSNSGARSLSFSKSGCLSLQLL
jgi:hypothetical protein